MAKAMNLEDYEMSANEELENQQDDGIACNEFINSKIFAIMAFENPGLYHIGENIFKNLDIQTKLTGRLVCKSWDAVFIKQALKIDLENVPKLSKFMEKYPIWSKFLQESKTEIPNLVLNAYLQNLLFRVTRNYFEEYYYRTPLLAFAIIGNSKIVDFILHMKTYTIGGNECYEALKNAAIYGHVNVAKLLAPYASNPNVVREDDYAPIHQAALNGHLEIVQLLASNTSNPNATNQHGRTPIHFAAVAGHLEVVKFLALRTSKPIIPDKNGFTAIHDAAFYGHLEIVKFLASYTLFPNVADKNGWTPAEYARSQGFLDVAAYFLELETKEHNELKKVLWTTKKNRCRECKKRKQIQDQT